MKKEPLPLKGLNVLVTGAASGIGRQVARDLFAEHHCNLSLLDLNEPGLRAFKDELKSDYRWKNAPRVEIHTCDIASQKSIDAFLSATSRRPVDVLINGAGIFYSGSFEKMTMEDFERVLQVNLFGTIRLTRTLIPKLLQSPRASIVTIASLAGLIGAPGMCAYSTSKFALVGFSESLRGELKDRVHVCTVCPAFVRTNIARNSALNKALGDLERTDRIESMDQFITKVGTSARKVSLAVIRAIREKETMVLVTPDARILYYMKRFLPTISDSLVARGYRKLLKTGVIRP